MQNVTLESTQGQWPAARLSRLALILAFCIPLFTIAVGTATGTRLEYLGGAMIAFWAFAIASFGLGIRAAMVEKELRQQYHRWITIVGAIIALGPVLKAVPLVVLTEKSTSFTTIEQPTQSSPSKSSSRGCRPELVSADNSPVSSSKDGRSGNVAWLFWIGNYYEWHLEVAIKADNNGSYGTAAAVGTMSSWFSVVPHKRKATAAARGNIDCKTDTTGCTCFAQSTSQTKTDKDFTAKVEITRAMTNGGADLDVAASAAVSGAPGADVNLGSKAGGIKLSVPNTSLDSVVESKSYSYRCSSIGP